MFENYYKKGSVNIIEENLEIGLDHDIFIFLCNMKLYELASTMTEGMGIFNSRLEQPLFKNIQGITYGDLVEFIKDKKSISLETRRCFVSTYEIFEKIISEILKYIHYKKPNIVLNKENSISCDKLLSEKTKEEIVEEMIYQNVMNIMYSKNIKDILKFISRYSKCSIDDLLVDGIFVISKMRNSSVHNNGKLSVEEYLEIKKYDIFDFEQFEIKDKSEIELEFEIETVETSINTYKKVISIICQGLKEQFEN